MGLPKEVQYGQRRDSWPTLEWAEQEEESLLGKSVKVLSLPLLPLPEQEKCPSSPWSALREQAIGLWTEEKSWSSSSRCQRACYYTKVQCAMRGEFRDTPEGEEGGGGSARPDSVDIFLVKDGRAPDLV